MKRFFRFLVIGGVLAFVGDVMADEGHKVPGGIILCLGVGVGVIGTFVQLDPLAREGVKELEAAVKWGRKKRTREDLLSYKKLLDEGVLTAEEYLSKTESLKQQLLNE